MLASVIHRPGVEYPESDEFFSPSESYPEYRHGRLAHRPNAVYAMVREVFAQAGLDHAHYGTAAWNPLGQFIPPGSKVFLLCNFVQHRRPTESARDFLGKCTHGSVLRALVDYVLLAAGEQGQVTFGNAPMQTCDFERVLRETGAAAVRDFFAQGPYSVQAKDLRLYVTERALSGRTTKVTLGDHAEGITVALDDSSFLQPLCQRSSTDAPAFRVADYDPETMWAWHDLLKHRYLVHRDILSADAIVCVPKLKTHEKVGVSCGLKGYVGIVGRKECLPHYRFGPPDHGGDEFPADNFLVSLSSRLSDWVCGRAQDKPLQGFTQIADHTLRRALRRAGCVTAGAWHGNDTAWRMALDLVRISHYADRGGTMREGVQRPNLVLVDGVLGGEADGPLAPKAVNSGSVVFSNNAALADWLVCRLMGFAPNAIPLVREGVSAFLGGFPQGDGERQTAVVNGQVVTAGALAPVLGRPFRPPCGWRRSLAPSSIPALE